MEYTVEMEKNELLKTWNAKIKDLRVKNKQTNSLGNHQFLLSKQTKETSSNSQDGVTGFTLTLETTKNELTKSKYIYI